MTATDLQPFVDAYQPDDRALRTESERFRSFSYSELTSRDQVNLDITWLKDDSHVDADDLPDPDVLAAEIIEDLKAALAEFEALADDLEEASP
jgi:type I restriction enzyme M protein